MRSKAEIEDEIVGIVDEHRVCACPVVIIGDVRGYCQHENDRESALIAELKTMTDKSTAEERLSSPASRLEQLLERWKALRVDWDADGSITAIARANIYGLCIQELEATLTSGPVTSLPDACKVCGARWSCDHEG